MTTAKWQDDFLKSTGFAKTLPRVKAPPPAKQQSPKEFEDFFRSGLKPAAHGPVPNTVTTPNQPVLPGKLPIENSPGIFRKPFPNENVLLNKDGSVPTYPTHQTGWQAPGIGNVVPRAMVDEPQSHYVPGAAAKGGYKFVTAAVDKMTEKLSEKFSEKLSVSSTKDKVSIGLLFCAGASGVAYLFRRQKKTREPAIWLLMFFVFALLSALSHFTGVFSEKQKGNITNESILNTDRLDPAVQLRDTKDFNPYPPPPYPADNIADRFAFQKTNTSTLEGPRRDVGYYRGAPTPPDGTPTLQENQLMRSAAQWNMDPGTFNEYMRRLNGENIPQIVQSHPYYAVNAAFEERAQINDSDTLYGITDQPSQANRKFPYKQPRMQQAGAKSMHLKNPPPGAVRPIEKTHPWMDKEEPSGPAIIADSMLSDSAQLTYEVEEENQQGELDRSMHDNLDSVFDNPVEKQVKSDGNDEDLFAAQFGQSSVASDDMISREVSEKPVKQKIKK